MSSWEDFLKFRARLDLAGIEVPSAITKGLELIEVAQGAMHPTTGGLLDLSPAGVVERVTEMSIRSHQGFHEDTRGMAPGVEQFVTGIVVEMRDAVLPDLDRMIVELQPTFEELAAPLVRAAEVFGFTGTTRAEEVIDRADEEASAAWRATRPAIAAISPIVSLRQTISAMFDVSPTVAEALNHKFYRNANAAMANVVGIDYSVCFAAGDNWSFDGSYYVEGKGRGRMQGQFDWLALAAGGLRLNTPDEVRAKRLQKEEALRATDPAIRAERVHPGSDVPEFGDYPMVRV